VSGLGFTVSAEMPGPVRFRQACDRCHGQKLRCTKQQGSSTCTRCARAGAICVFSPPNLSHARGPGLSVSVDAQGIMNDELALLPDIDWSAVPMEYGHLLSPPSLNGLPSAPSLPGDHSGVNSLRSDGGNGRAMYQQPQTNDTAVSCVRQLTNTLVELDFAWRTLTAAAVHLPAKQLIEYGKMAGVKDQHRVVLEQVLSASQILADLYPNTLALGVDKSTDTCSEPNCIHHITAEMPKELCNMLPGSASKIDYSLLNLLFSCHLRLLDVFGVILQYIYHCVKLAKVTPGHEPQFDAPELRIGSYILPPDASASAFAAIITELLFKLTNCATSFADAIHSVEDESSREHVVLKLQVDILKDRAEGQMQQMKLVTDLLISQGLLK
jgi:hypothetical protein